MFCGTNAESKPEYSLALNLTGTLLRKIYGWGLFVYICCWYVTSIGGLTKMARVVNIKLVPRLYL